MFAFDKDRAHRRRRGRGSTMRSAAAAPDRPARGTSGSTPTPASVGAGRDDAADKRSCSSTVSCHELTPSDTCSASSGTSSMRQVPPPTSAPSSSPRCCRSVTGGVASPPDEDQADRRAHRHVLRVAGAAASTAALKRRPCPRGAASGRRCRRQDRRWGVAGRGGWQRFRCSARRSRRFDRRRRSRCRPRSWVFRALRPPPSERAVTGTTAIDQAATGHAGPAPTASAPDQSGSLRGDHAVEDDPLGRAAAVGPFHGDRGRLRAGEGGIVDAADDAEVGVGVRIGLGIDLALGVDDAGIRRDAGCGLQRRTRRAATRARARQAGPPPSAGAPGRRAA